MEEATVLIVGAGPSGLATSSCLNSLSISNIVLEREDCVASLWRKRSYDRLSLHLSKSYCALPYKNHYPKTPTFMSKGDFIAYIDDYVTELTLEPQYSRCVESVIFDKAAEKWRVDVKNSVSGAVERYVATFLVVATGENSEAFTPTLKGIESFNGETIHSCDYKSGKPYEGKAVLVVGSGNSGMEISNDLSDFNAQTSIVVRSEFHVLTKRMVQFGMLMGKWLPIALVDKFITMVAKLNYGDLSNYGIRIPSTGPFVFKKLTGKTPVIDGGSIEKIKANKIKIVPEVESINGDYVRFKDGTEKRFDAIIFATGYKSTANKWLKDYYKYVFDGEGMPKNKYPNHWKGENGIYCAGMSGNGLPGISSDATTIAADISQILSLKKKSA